MWFLILVIFFLASPTPAHAETMLSPTYQLRFGNFNMTSGTKTSAGYSLTDTVGQTVANQFTSTGYSIGAGSQYLYTLYDFSFSVSKTAINLGSLPLGSFATDTNILTVSAPRQGYTISTIASSRLKNGSQYIANTTCNTTCSATVAGVWTSASSYGFGYNMQGNDVSADFTGPTLFRPFPDASISDTPAPIMTTVNAGIGRTATTTYQLALNPTQATGTYENLIYYIAVPNY